MERRSPRLLRQYVGNLSNLLISMRAVVGLERSELARLMRRSGRVIIVNSGVMVFIISMGTFSLNYADDLAQTLNLREGILGWR